MLLFSSIQFSVGLIQFNESVGVIVISYETNSTIKTCLKALTEIEYMKKKLTLISASCQRNSV